MSLLLEVYTMIYGNVILENSDTFDKNKLFDISEVEKYLSRQDTQEKLVKAGSTIFKLLGGAILASTGMVGPVLFVAKYIFGKYVDKMVNNTILKQDNPGLFESIGKATKKFRKALKKKLKETEEDEDKEKLTNAIQTCNKVIKQCGVIDDAVDDVPILNHLI